MAKLCSGALLIQLLRTEQDFNVSMTNPKIGLQNSWFFTTTP
jgi:hypothetical protein